MKTVGSDDVILVEKNGVWVKHSSGCPFCLSTSHLGQSGSRSRSWPSSWSVRQNYVRTSHRYLPLNANMDNLNSWIIRSPFSDHTPVSHVLIWLLNSKFALFSNLAAGRSTCVGASLFLSINLKCLCPKHLVAEVTVQFRQCVFPHFFSNCAETFLFIVSAVDRVEDASARSHTEVWLPGSKK